jgi:hypothetical protein
MRCIFHVESTPSLVLYEKRFKCYGCGKSGLLTELPAELQPKEGEIETYEKEDLKEKYRYICSLPKKRIRGLDLHADERGYFITWPDQSYFKYRLYDNTANKYLSPRGHRPPLLWVRRTGAAPLFITEGEVNAITLSQCVSGDICSPGSATNFANLLKRELTTLQEYSRVTVVLDDDAAGWKALIETKALLIYKIPFVDFLMISKPDINDNYVKGGKEAVLEVLSRTNPR